jgi:hypothetical protein
MINTGKWLGCLILISLAMVFLSCERYNILWRDYTANNTDGTIKLYFKKGREWRDINIYKNKTDSFYVFKTSIFSGFELTGNNFIYIYPFFENKKTSEIFIFDVQILERNSTSVIMGIKNDVTAYYADFYIDNYRYTVISRDNTLTINNLQELKNLNDIIKSLDFDDYTYRYEGQKEYNGMVLCGFIVKSHIDNSFILLKQEYGSL